MEAHLCYSTFEHDQTAAVSENVPQSKTGHHQARGHVLQVSLGHAYRAAHSPMSATSRCLSDTRVLALDEEACSHKQAATALGARFSNHFAEHDPPHVCIATTVCSKSYRVWASSCLECVFVSLSLASVPDPPSYFMQVVADKVAEGHIASIPFVRPSWLKACQEGKSQVASQAPSPPHLCC